MTCKISLSVSTPQAAGVLLGPALDLSVHLGRTALATRLSSDTRAWDVPKYLELFNFFQQDFVVFNSISLFASFTKFTLKYVILYDTIANCIVFFKFIFRLYIASV